MIEIWDKRAQVAVLGAIMLSPACLSRIDLEETDFYGPAHQTIFRTMREMVLSKVPPRPVLIADALGEKSKAVGCRLSDLAAIARDALTADNVEHYAEIVRRKSLGRTIRAGADAVAKSDLDGDELLAQFQQVLGQLNKRVPDGATTMAELAVEAFEDIRGLVDGEITRDIVPTGLAQLDYMLGGGLEPGSTTIVGGGTSEGKSAMLKTIANNVARVGGGVDYYSLESTKQALGRRALAEASGIEGMKLRRFDARNQWSRPEMDALVRGVDELIRTGKRWRITSRAGLSSADIALRVRAAREVLGTTLVVVDYLQLVSERAENRTQVVGAASKGLKQLAINENLPMLTASQFSRKGKDAPKRQPTLQDLRDSGDIEQDADNALLIIHDWDQDWHGVLVGKQRDGPVGKVQLDWDKERTAWRDFKGER